MPTEENAVAGPSSPRPPAVATVTPDEDGDKERCSICLMPLVDRTAAGPCGHEFCFTCIGVWANQSRSCPLCNAEMADCLVHDLDASTPTKFFLPPLPELGFARRSIAPAPPSATSKEGYRAHVAAATALEAAVAHRRDVYSRGLYAKHIPSNGYTGFRANPSPRDMITDGASAARARSFLARELRVWAPPTDVEELADYIVGLLKAVDARSEPLVQMLAPLVDGTYLHAADHLAHELYSFLRSPYADLTAYDEVVQYDDEPSEPLQDAPREEAKRGRSGSRSSTLPSASRSRSPFSDYSDRSRSPRRRSRSRSRDPTRPDTFVPSPSRNDRRWDEADTWIDPEYAAWMEAEQSRVAKRVRRRDQRARARARDRDERLAIRGAATHATEPPGPTLTTFNRAAASAGLSIRGSDERRQSLLERLARAKGESGGSPVEATSGGQEAGPNYTSNAEQDNMGESTADRRARELRTKLLAERKTRQLREQLLARKRAKTVQDAAAESAASVSGAGKAAATGSSKEGSTVGAESVGEPAPPAEP